MTIVEFLEARLLEDEAAAVQCQDDWSMNGFESRIEEAWNHLANPVRAIRDVAVKRELVAREEAGRCQGHPKPWMRHGEYGAGFCFTPPEGSVLYVLASAYSDHPDFNPDWAE